MVGAMCLLLPALGYFSTGSYFSSVAFVLLTLAALAHHRSRDVNVIYTFASVGMALICMLISLYGILTGNAPHSRVAFLNIAASLFQYFVLNDETEPTPTGTKAAIYLNCSLAAYAFSGASFGLPMWSHCTALWITVHVHLTETSKSERFSSYAVSVIHACIMSLFCAYHASYAFTDADPFDSSTPEAQNVYWANQVFAAYLIHDIVYVIFDPSEAKSILMHHFGFLSVSIMNGTLRMFPSAFIWLIAGKFEYTSCGQLYITYKHTHTRI
jgi:hypothetical protein